MRNIVAFIFCLCLLPMVSDAQESLETETFRISDDCSYEVILPTLNNLLSIVNMDVATFKATMSSYRYHPDEQLSGSAYVYTNSNLDFYLDNNNGLGVNTVMFDPSAGKNKFAGFWIFHNQAYPRTCIQDLYQQLSPYYQKTAGGKRYYGLKYNGYSYGIEISTTQGNESTVIHIYEFYK